MGAREAKNDWRIADHCVLTFESGTPPSCAREPTVSNRQMEPSAHCQRCPKPEHAMVGQFC
jgi:hypothetical protein